MPTLHTPVLPQEVLELLMPQRGGLFVDATLGLGGHTRLILESAQTTKNPIKLLGLDQDSQALEMAKENLQKFASQTTFIQANFAELESIIEQNSAQKADGILMDLGVSSYQIDTPERGFSFQTEGPLDMRMNPDADLTAAEVVNTYPEPKLVEIFFKYGEERLSRKIAHAIVTDRQKEPYRDTKTLAELIVRLYPPIARYRHPHPATRVFQALRMEVNQELQVLEEGLLGALNSLNKGGRLAVISFHSLEDRIVKHLFRDKVGEGEFQLLTKKPVMASEEELQVNPRSRSAKLRAIERL